MKAILILKGILLYITTVATMLFVCAVDSLYDKGYFFLTIFIVTGLIYACVKTITKEEFYTLSGTKLFGEIPDEGL